MQALGPNAPAPGAGVGLYLVAFEVEDEAALRSIYRRFPDDVGVSSVDHGISKAPYFSDPDGNGVEVYVDTRSGTGERWLGVSQPFDPEELGDDTSVAN